MSAKNGLTASGMIVAAMAALMLPASAAAQAALVRADAAPGTRADDLHARAEALYATPARYAEAAQLLVRAARAREDTDVRAVKELSTAAKLYSYAGWTRNARSTMKLAAGRALEFGDVAGSAHAYVDAAFLAISQKDWTDASNLVARAQQLAAAQHLADAERDDILQRIAPVRVGLRTTGR